MAFEKNAAHPGQNAAGTEKKKKSRRPDSPDRARYADRKYEYREPEYPGDDEGIREQEGKTAKKGGGILLMLLCILLIAAGAWLMYKDINRTYRHGIYRCEGGRMMEEPAEPDEEKITAASDRIKTLAETYPDLQQYMMLVPAAACIQSEFLPDGVQVRDQKADLAQIRSKMPAGLQWIDLTEALSEHAGEKLYYASDSYLTGWGSRYAARAAMTGMEVKIPEGEDVCYLLSNTFTGRLAQDRIPSLEVLEQQGERLEIYVPAEEACYYRVNGKNGEWSGSVYDSAAAQSGQPYNVFFGGEKALTQIHTTAINGETLLVVGDRTADSIVPLFVSSFEHIIFIHPSKCAKTVDDLIGEYGVTKVLYLYGANTYMTDRTLLRALQ